MIVRVSGEGQFEVADQHAEHLNQLDNAVVDAVAAGSHDVYRQLFDEMLALVRGQGRALDGDDLRESEVILPPPDTTFEEAAAEFTGDGLIPG